MALLLLGSIYCRNYKHTVVIQKYGELYWPPGDRATAWEEVMKRSRKRLMVMGMEVSKKMMATVVVFLLL